MTDSPQPSEIPEEVLRCYRCEAELAEDDRLCPQCGRLQYRVCYCGQQFLIAMDTCPHCGADWSHSARTRKARRKSHARGSLRGLLRSTAIGAMACLLICGFLYYSGGRAAERILSADAPTGFLPRVGYLGLAVGLWFQNMSHNASNFTLNRHSLLFIALLATGGALGACTYLLRHNAWVMARLGLDKRRRRRRTV